MPRGSSRASSGLRGPNIPISNATPPNSATVLAKPAVTCQIKGAKGILPANSPAGEFLLGSIGGFLRQGNTKPETQIGRGFRRPDGADQGLRNPPLREFSRTSGADFEVRGNLLHGCAGHSAVKVCGELLA